MVNGVNGAQHKSTPHTFTYLIIKITQIIFNKTPNYALLCVGQSFQIIIKTVHIFLVNSEFLNQLSCIVHFYVKSKLIFSRFKVDAQDVTSFLENCMISLRFCDILRKCNCSKVVTKCNVTSTID